MREFSDKLSGSITYGYFFTPSNIEAKTREQAKKALLKCTGGNEKAVFYENGAKQEEAVFKDIATAESFLHGAGLPFDCVRVIFEGEKYTHESINVTDSSVMLSFYYDVGVMQVSVSVSVENEDTDTFIYLHHRSANFSDTEGQKKNPGSIFESLMAKLGLSYEENTLTTSYCAEINKAYGYEDVSLLAKEESKRLYGILSGDEGWRHVPAELAESRVANKWSSRDFVHLIIFGPSFIILNLNEGTFCRDYLEHQSDFGTRFYSGLNPYFTMHSSVPGINHGIFFAIEMGMVVKVIADRTMHHHEQYQQTKSATGLRSRIQMTKNYRIELISTLNRVESVKMTELGELEMAVLESQRITPIIDKVKYLLELLESELDLLYQTSTNKLVNILTVAGLLLSVMGIVYSHIQTFGLPL